MATHSPQISARPLVARALLLVKLPLVVPLIVGTGAVAVVIQVGAFAERLRFFWSTAARSS